jgi:FKBP-type peptidyl-prolyl cis-trans isomerase
MLGRAMNEVRSVLVPIVFASGFLALSLGCESKPKEEAPAVEAAPAAPAASAPATAAAAPAATAATAPSADPPELAAPADVAAPPADAKRTASGLASKVLKAGTGKDRPKPTDSVKVHYTGWTRDGKVFDSSLRRNVPVSFAVTQVIPGWTEGLQLMTVGEKRRLWIPAKLAYGDRPRMGAPSGDLTFDVELIEIVAPPEAPKDVKKPAPDAKKTASGLAYKVLKKGTGKEHPSADSRVTVHYSGWTPDGKLFDSSVTSGNPLTFPLNGVIKGWTEGVQLMVVGDKTRFWVPSELAYGDKPTRPDAPAGPLVFEIELLNIAAGTR